VISGLIACAPAAPEVVAPPPPAPLKACSVELSGVYHKVGPGIPAFGTASSDMLVKTAVFTVSNPNDYLVSVDRLEYKLDVGEGVLVIDEISPKYFIPAGEQITVEGIVCIAWADLYKSRLDAGILGADAIPATLPLWKGLGGGCPNLIYYSPIQVDNDTWAAVEATKVVYKWETRLHTSGEGMDKWAVDKGSL